MGLKTLRPSELPSCSPTKLDRNFVLTAS